MKNLLIRLIKIYQKLPFKTNGCCRFTPTCSAYAIEAIEVHGTLKGSFLAIKRILKCNPWHKPGFDYVPPKK